MRHLFILDPLDRLHVDGDTSIAFIREAWRRGHTVETCEVGDLGQRDGAPFVRAAVTSAGERAWAEVEAARIAPLSGYDAVWMRKDPPLDDAYLFATLLMSRADGPVMVNDPAALRDENEKLFALEFPELCPTTLVSRDVQDLLAFRDGRFKLIHAPDDGTWELFDLQADPLEQENLWEQRGAEFTDWAADLELFAEGRGPGLDPSELDEARRGRRPS